MGEYIEKFSIGDIIFRHFLGRSGKLYKFSILFILILNCLLFFANPLLVKLIDFNYFFLGWAIVIETIYILMMSTKCHPLVGLSLILLQSVLFGVANSNDIYGEIEANLSVISLVIFSVTFIYFNKDFLNLLFSKIFLYVRSKTKLAFVCFTAMAVLSAFLDALTVSIIIISACLSLYKHSIAYLEQKGLDEDKFENKKLELQDFLKSIIMHSVIGTAVGGVSTMIGEPQNYLIAKAVNWDFRMFSIQMLPLVVPLYIFGAILCVCLEKFKVLSYGAILDGEIIDSIFDKKTEYNKIQKVGLALQGVSLIIFVAFILSGILEVGLAALLSIGLITSVNGINKEEDIGKAFEEAMPFASLIILFFAIVSIINDLHLFEPIIGFVFLFTETSRAIILFIGNSVLSMVSDNVFVASIFVNELIKLHNDGVLGIDEFERLAEVVNIGTNVSSIATPNGQAPLLFLLTSTMARYVGLSYRKILLMALPYTILFGIISLLFIYFRN